MSNYDVGQRVPNNLLKSDRWNIFFLNSIVLKRQQKFTKLTQKKYHSIVTRKA